MSITTSQLADCVGGYAARLHAVIGDCHHVASPLGAWLLLALAGPASTGADQDALTDVLGCAVDDAAQAAARLLADPHPLVASAAAVWTAPAAPSTESFRRWLGALPTPVTTGELPDQTGLDGWARAATGGLIETFPVKWAREAYLVLASALATRVSWQTPFALVPADRLGATSPWSGRLSQVLATPPSEAGPGHRQFVAVTERAGDVIVQLATAAGGLLVISVAGRPDVPFGEVLAAAHDLGRRSLAGAQITVRQLADLPLGEGLLWTVREVTAAADSCRAVLPAWSATSEHELTDPVLGFAAALHGLLPSADPFEARQSAVARYSRTGFEAAAVTGGARLAALRRPSRHREAELRFGHPYAVVAFAAEPAPAADASPWAGLPVFSAWVSAPEDAGPAAGVTA